MNLERKNICPLKNAQCIGLDCAWFTQLRGTHPNTGAEIDEPVFLASFPNRYGFGATIYHTCDLYFRAEVLTRPQDWRLAAGEVSDLVWLAPDEVDPQDLAFESLRRVWELLTRTGFS